MKIIYQTFPGERLLVFPGFYCQLKIKWDRLRVLFMFT